MMLLKQVLKITFMTTLHHVKQYLVTVMAGQATAYHTDRSNTNFFNKLLIKKRLNYRIFFIIQTLFSGPLNFKLTNFHRTQITEFSVNSYITHASFISEVNGDICHMRTLQQTLCGYSFVI
jgi:hypothetical protein